MKKLLFLPLLALAAGCRHDQDPTPSGSYDELALATGHWEWDATVLGFAGNYTPATEGYTRQLVFGPDKVLTLRRSGQPAYTTPYELSMGTLPRCGTGTKSFPIVTYTTNETTLPNSPRKTYTISQRNGRQELSIAGEAFCVDVGAYETYHWVAE